MSLSIYFCIVKFMFKWAPFNNYVILESDVFFKYVKMSSAYIPSKLSDEIFWSRIFNSSFAINIFASSGPIYECTDTPSVWRHNLPGTMNCIFSTHRNTSSMYLQRGIQMPNYEPLITAQTCSMVLRKGALMNKDVVSRCIETYRFSLDLCNAARKMRSNFIFSININYSHAVVWFWEQELFIFASEI